MLYSVAKQAAFCAAVSGTRAVGACSSSGCGSGVGAGVVVAAVAAAAAAIVTAAAIAAAAASFSLCASHTAYTLCIPLECSLYSTPLSR